MPFEYSSSLVRVVDGDTIRLCVDLGFHVSIIETFRLARIDTPEINSKDAIEREKANKAKQFVISMFEKHNLSCIIKTEKPKNDKYGRWIAEIIFRDATDSINLSTLLVSEGLAVYKNYE